MRRRLAEGLAVLLSIATLGAGAASGPSSLEAAMVTPPPVFTAGGLNSSKPTSLKSRVSPVRVYQVGIASWYGEQFQGRQTASGEPFDMLDFTAAHPSLPLGTIVKVTNLRNGRTVVVRINDRGPVVDGRIIDLSYNAARALDFQERGVQKVRLDPYPPANLGRSFRPSDVALLRPVAKLN
jgi:rare lipoprotein A